MQGLHSMRRSPISMNYGRHFRKNKSSKRGQAAMEYLATYGWALLVILMVIASINYFGIISFNRWIPDICIFEQGIGCVEYIVDATPHSNGSMTHNHITLIIKNNFQKDMKQVSMNFALEGATCQIYASGWGTPAPSYIAAGNQNTYCIECDPSQTTYYSQSSFFKADMRVTYTMVGETISHLQTGELSVHPTLYSGGTTPCPVT